MVQRFVGASKVVVRGITWKYVEAGRNHRVFTRECGIRGSRASALEDQTVGVEGGKIVFREGPAQETT